MGASSSVRSQRAQELAPMGRSYNGRQPGLPWLVGTNAR